MNKFTPTEQAKAFQKSTSITLNNKEPFTITRKNMKTFTI